MATTINKKYTITMTLSDGNTATADFTIPVACPTAAEVKCVEDWTETKSSTKDMQTLSDDTHTSYRATYIFTFGYLVNNITVNCPAVDWPGYYGWQDPEITNTNGKTTVNVKYLGKVDDVPKKTTDITVSVTGTIVNNVDNRLAYLYAHHV